MLYQLFEWFTKNGIKFPGKRAISFYHFQGVGGSVIIAVYYNSIW